MSYQTYAAAMRKVSKQIISEREERRRLYNASIEEYINSRAELLSALELIASKPHTFWCKWSQEDGNCICPVRIAREAIAITGRGRPLRFAQLNGDEYLSQDDAEANSFFHCRPELLSALKLIASEPHTFWCRCRYWILTVVNRWHKSQREEQCTCSVGIALAAVVKAKTDTPQE